jgi:hypothetical protein
MIGFINTLYSHLVLNKQYSDIADLHKLQFTITHALGFSAFNSLLLVKELKQSHCD